MTFAEANFFANNPTTNDFNPTATVPTIVKVYTILTTVTKKRWVIHPFINTTRNDRYIYQ
jgi:hypothetical protein